LGMVESGPVEGSDYPFWRFSQDSFAKMQECFVGFAGFSSFLRRGLPWLQQDNMGQFERAIVW